MVARRDDLGDAGRDGRREEPEIRLRARHGSGLRGTREPARAELSELVRAPARDRPAFEQRTVEREPGRDRARPSRQPAHQHRRRAGRARVVAELAEAVVAPAGHPAVGQQRAGVVGARRDGGRDSGQAGDLHLGCWRPPSRPGPAVPPSRLPSTQRRPPESRAQVCSPPAETGDRRRREARDRRGSRSFAGPAELIQGVVAPAPDAAVPRDPAGVEPTAASSVVRRGTSGTGTGTLRTDLPRCRSPPSRASATS